MANEVKVKMKLEKETKGAVRYEEQGDNPKVGTQYIKKFALPSPPPQEIEVTISWK